MVGNGLKYFSFLQMTYAIILLYRSLFYCIEKLHAKYSVLKFFLVVLLATSKKLLIFINRIGHWQLADVKVVASKSHKIIDSLKHHQISLELVN